MHIFLLFGPGTPATVGSCVQSSDAARECCPCEGGSRRPVLEGGGELRAAAGTEKTGQGLRNAAAQDGTPERGGCRMICHWNF